MRPIIVLSLQRASNIAWLAGLLLATSMQSHAQASANALPAGDGRELLAVACTQCHGLRPIVMMRDGPAGWKTTVSDMILRGAQLSPPETDAVIQYLSKNFGPGSAGVKTSAQPGKVAAANLPDGAGKDAVEARCTLCHGLDKIVGEKRSNQEWTNTVKNMVERGLSATPEEIQAMTSYLTSQFGK